MHPYKLLSDSIGGISDTLLGIQGHNYAPLGYSFTQIEYNIYCRQTLKAK